MDSSLHSKPCYLQKWKMNTDRNCAVKDTLQNISALWIHSITFINCAIKDTLLNTDELCVQGHVCEH